MQINAQPFKINVLQIYASTATNKYDEFSIRNFVKIIDYLLETLGINCSNDVYAHGKLHLTKAIILSLSISNRSCSYLNIIEMLSKGSLVKNQKLPSTLTVSK